MIGGEAVYEQVMGTEILVATVDLGLDYGR
jgi:hypothetical protein